MLAEMTERLIERALINLVWRATVTGTSGSSVLIQRIGAAAADTKAYPKLAAYSSPTNGDEVLVLTVPIPGIGTIVLGKIVR